MSNEFIHGSVGTSLSQAEFEAVGLHVLNSQATGDLIYASSATQLSRLAIGSTSALLQVLGGIPSWTSEIDGITLDSAVAKGTWTASGTWTIPAVTLSGAITAGGQNITGAGSFSVAGTGTFGPNVNNSFARYQGGATTDVQIIMFGVEGSNSVRFDTGSSAAQGSGTIRLTIAGGAATVVATWAAITQTWSSYGAGTITADASGNLTSVSDERLKNIQGFSTSGLAEILAINPILYKWNELSGMETDNIYTGFSAQNVMKYLPGAVGKNNDGYYTFSERPIVAALVNAVKELQSEIDKLNLKVSLPQKNLTVIALLNEKGIIKSRPPLVVTPTAP